MRIPQTKVSNTGEILKSIDDDSNEEVYGPKLSDLLAQRIEGKWQTKLTSKKVKEKSQNLLTPENCMRLSIPLINKEIWKQLNNFQKKSDLRILSIQSNIQKAEFVAVRATDGLLQANCKSRNQSKETLMQYHFWALYHKNFLR